MLSSAEAVISLGPMRRCVVKQLMFIYLLHNMKYFNILTRIGDQNKSNRQSNYLCAKLRFLVTNKYLT